jgi:hypothetical protein
MVLGIFALIVLFILWKLFVEGLLFKIIIFAFGWLGMYVWLRGFVPDAMHTAVTLGQHFEVSWAALVPTVICLCALLFTKGDK